LQHIYIKVLLDLKDLPFIGSYCRNIVFNHILYSYDICATFVESLEFVERICISFPLEQKFKDMVIAESEHNRYEAEQYLHGYLSSNFPEIT